jgi:tetratricopeptide (TPR) repeat protein
MPCRTLLLLAFLLVACASAEKRYEQAQQAEAEGRWAAAADLYIDALRRDPDYPGAKEGLRASGRKAVAAYLELAGKLATSGQHEQAVDEFKRADSLISRAASARVALDVPSDYAERRRAAFDRAIGQALGNADSLATAGKYEAAAAAYASVVERYDPSAEQRAHAQDGRYGALVAAARQALADEDMRAAESLVEQALSVYGADASRSAEARDLRAAIVDARYRSLLASAEERAKAGHYQEAYTLVLDALKIHGEDAAESADARALRDRVLAEGTVRVAVTPVWRTDRAARQVPAGFLDEVNDLLEDGALANPPLFIAALDGKDVRDALRALGLDRRVLPASQAVAVGHHVDADYVVLADVRGCVVGAGAEKPQIVKVATTDGRGAELRVFSRRTVTVDCDFRIVRVVDGAVVAEKSARADAENRLRYAVQVGDAKDLLLTEEQHRLLDGRRLAEVDRSLEKDTAAALAKALGVAYYEELRRRLP